jgi:nucleoside-diphosphate-sugar epimerase
MVLRSGLAQRTRVEEKRRAMGERTIAGTVLITGASGFIGGRLRDAVLAAGADVVALRRVGSKAPRHGRSVEVDYADVDALRRVVDKERPTLVFHVAGTTKGVTYEDFQRANVMPTRNLLEALRLAHPDVRRFVHISSLASYGPSRADRPHREDAPRRPLEHYGRSKLEAEKTVEAMGAAVPWTILRPAGVYGPGDVDYFELFKSVERGINVFFGNKERWFSALYVDDLVRAALEVALHPAAQSKGYFVCDGRPITWGEFQRLIVEASGRRVLTVDLPERLVDVAAFGGELLTRFDNKPRLFNRQKALMGMQEAWTCQHDALRTDVGYVPTVDAAEGVARTLAWYRAERWL